MINPKNGEYTPVKVYDRKLLRGVLKHKIEKKNGYHQVNKTLHSSWINLKELANSTEE